LRKGGDRSDLAAVVRKFGRQVLKWRAVCFSHPLLLPLSGPKTRMNLSKTQTEAFLDWLECNHGRLEISNNCPTPSLRDGLLLNGKSVTQQHLHRYAADWLRVTNPATGVEIMTVVNTALLFVMSNASVELCAR